MKILQKTLFAVLAGSLMTAGAQAAVNYGNGMTAQPYIGAKIGQYDIDEAKDEAFSYGIYGGAKFTPNFGIEAEYLMTSEETAIEESGSVYDVDWHGKTEYDAKVYGLYATYDYVFPNSGGLYAKGRLGIAKNEIELNTKATAKNTGVPGSKEVSAAGKEKFSDSGIAGGLGLGYNIAPNAAIELAYEWYPEVEDTDVNGITLGANFKF